MDKKRNRTIGRRLAWLLTFILAMEGMLQNAGVLEARAEEAAGSGTAQSAIEVTRSDGYAEGAYAEWKPVAGADGYLVYVSQTAEQEQTSQDARDARDAQDASDLKPVQTDWTLLDDELIRSYDGFIRADALGLKAGIWNLKIVAGTFDSERKLTGTVAETIVEVTVTAHDRSGYAWVNGTASGAYNEDGSLKENARVIYITEETKNTVKLEVTGASANPCVGLQNIMNGYKNAKESRPLAVRIIGNITDPAVLSSGDLSVETSTTNKPGITIEGVGEDAVANGWGISIKNSSNLEVRNLGFMNCNSGEGDNVSLVQGNDHIWVHNCDMFYGEAGSDDDQKKGDGALDCKWSDYVTFSYNHFWDSGKCNLLGLGEGHDKEYHITYHHNWYDHSDSRHPRVRFYTAHVYNNYYDGNSKYGIGGAGGGGSIFAENNYFRNCKYPMLISMQGSDVYNGSGTFSKEDGSIIKAYGNYMEGQTRFVAYEEQDDPETDWDESVDFDAYVAKSRDEIVPDTVKTVLPSKTVVFKEGCTGGNTYNNFDTKAGFYKYTPDAAQDVPAIVKARAGRLGGGDFQWTFDNETADKSYDVDVELQKALKSYTSKLKFVGGIMGASTKINCTVTFDPGNGEAVKKVTVEVNQPVAQPENPVKIPEGKVSFDGWYKGDTKWNFSDKVTGDMTLVGKWYAEGEGPEEIFHGGTPIGTEKIIHDFTQSGLSSKYFAIKGEMHSKSNSGQTVEYDGKVYKGKGLVLDSSTEITFFTTTQSAKLVMLIRFYSENKKVIIDGVTYKSTPGVIEAQLKPGEHTIKGSGSDYLFALIVIPEGESVIPIYTITLDPANGAAVKTIVRAEGKQITAEDLPTPTKEGDTFLGWTDEDGKEITLPYTPTKSMTIKAKWKNGGTQPGPGPDDPIDPDEVGLHVRLKNPSETYTYKGIAIKPEIVVSNNGKRLVEGRDYTVKYTNNIKACEWGEEGDAVKDAPKNAPKITVTGKGNFSGSTFTNFRIAKKDIGKDNDTDETQPVEAGALTVAKNSKATPILIYNGVKLGAKDYSYVDAAQKNKKWGDPAKEADEIFDGEGGNEKGIVLQGEGNYKGTRTVTVKAVKKDNLKTFTVTVGKVDLTYNGLSQTLANLSAGTVTVKDKKDKHDLTEHTDYEIVYGGDTINAGTVKFSVVGINNYTGTVTKTYKIKPMKDSSQIFVDDTATKAGYAYDAQGVMPGDDIKVYYGSDASGKPLEEGTDYKLTYSKNKKRGTAGYTVTLQGNFKGAKKTGSFNIVEASLKDSEAQVEAADKVFKKAGVYKSAPIVTINGVALKASDYKVEYGVADGDGNVPAGEWSSNPRVAVARTTIKVKVTGKGNYKTGDDHCVYGEYQVCEKGTKDDLSKAKVTFYEKKADDTKGNQVTKFDYTGKTVEPYVEVTINGQTEPLKPGVDYTVVYLNNKNKGKATVIITAAEDSTKYVGSKTAKFSIVAKNLKTLPDLLGGLFKGGTVQGWFGF